MERIIEIAGKEEIVTPSFSVNKEYFINEFIKDKEKFNNLFNNCKTELNQKRYSIINHNLYNEYFADTITIWSNENYLGPYTTFNYGEYKAKIQKYLNIQNILNNTDPFFLIQINNKLEELNYIRKKEVLEEKFPLLYDIYVNGNKKNEVIDNYLCGISPNVPTFRKKQIEYFENAISNLDKIREIYADNPINQNEILLNAHIRKLELYYAKRLLEIVNNNNDIKAYYALNKYFNSRKDESTIITLEDGSTLSYTDLLTNYDQLENNKQLLKRN